MTAETTPGSFSEDILNMLWSWQFYKMGSKYACNSGRYKVSFIQFVTFIKIRTQWYCSCWDSVPFNWLLTFKQQPMFIKMLYRWWSEIKQHPTSHLSFSVKSISYNNHFKCIWSWPSDVSCKINSVDKMNATSPQLPIFGKYRRISNWDWCNVKCGALDKALAMDFEQSSWTILRKAFPHANSWDEETTHSL